MPGLDIKQTIEVIGDIVDLAEASFSSFAPGLRVALAAADLALSVAEFSYDRDPEETEKEYEEDRYIGTAQEESPLAEVSLDLNSLNYSEDPQGVESYSQAA